MIRQEASIQVFNCRSCGYFVNWVPVKYIMDSQKRDRILASRTCAESTNNNTMPQKTSLKEVSHSFLASLAQETEQQGQRPVMKHRQQSVMRSQSNRLTKVPVSCEQ